MYGKKAYEAELKKVINNYSDIKELSREDAEKELERLGGEITGGKMRENDQDYFMDGYFDGKRCTIVLFSYKSIVYKISVFLEDSYKKKFDAFLDLMIMQKNYKKSIMMKTIITSLWTIPMN